jgi:predicted phage terminase large subunit-like protein
MIDELTRRDFKTFAKRAFNTLGIQVEWNWHIDALLFFAFRVAEEDFQYGMVNIPPRSLKTEIFSVILPAFLLGHDPACKVICVSYGQDLAEKFGAATRRIMESDWYRQAFPGTVLAKRAQGELVTTRAGCRFATSIGGQVTGRGGDVIIVDDPLKADDAESDAIRNHTNEWIASTLFTRLDDKRTGRFIMVAQRLHQDDPCGRALSTGAWELLSIPAIAMEARTFDLGDGRTYVRPIGEVMHAGREPLSLLDNIKINQGSRRFAAQYQQEPVPADGSLFKRAWFKTAGPELFDRRPGDRTLQAWDAASKDGDQNDFSVCVTAILRRSELYIVDVFRARLTFPALKQKVIELARTYRPSRLVIEDAAAGTQLIQVLRDEQPAKVSVPIGITVSKNKIERALVAVDKAEQGVIFLPDNAPWRSDFMDELTAFPFGRFDDQVDAFAHMVREAAGDVRIRFSPEALRRLGGEIQECGDDPDIIDPDMIGDL